MQVEYTNLEQDVVALNEHLCERSASVRRQFRLAWFGFTAFLLVGGLALLAWSTATGEDSVALYGFCMILLAPCWIVFYPWQYYRQLRSRVRKLVREGQNRGVLGTHTMTLSPNELAYSSEWGHGVLYWPAVERIDEAANHVFIFVSSMSAFAIPKRDFNSVQACEKFVETARRYHEETGAPAKPVG